MHTYTDVKADYILCKFQSLLPHERDLNNARRRLREKGKKSRNKIKYVYVPLESFSFGI